ncbi:MAG: histidine phosphatase family protein [Mycobacteriales bacterium]
MTTAPPLPVTPVNAAMQAALLVDGGPRTEVLLVRHGQQHYADDNAPRSLANDPPLSVTGRDQARRLGEALAGAPVDAVYSSDLRRARETADLVVAARDDTPRREVVHGLHEVQIYRSIEPGRAVADALTAQQLSAIGDAFIRTRSFDAFPTGEPSRELRNRARAGIEPLAAAHPGGRVVVVCHGGLLNAFLADVLGMSTDMFFFPAHASVTSAYTSEGRWALGTANSTGHLGELVTF